MVSKDIPYGSIDGIPAQVGREFIKILIKFLIDRIPTFRTVRKPFHVLLAVLLCSDLLSSVCIQ